MYKLLLSVLLLVTVSLWTVSAAATVSHVVTTLTGKQGQVSVSFRTLTKPKAPAVRYWITTTAAKNVKIPASGVHAWTRPVNKATPEYIAVQILSSLTLDKTYHYRVTADITAAKPVWSSIYTFKTKSHSSSYHVALFGDLGASGSGLQKKYPGSIAAYAAGGKIDLTLHYGDLAYNLWSYSGRVGDAFFNNMGPVLAGAPYVAGVGNHEYMSKSMDYYLHWFIGQNSIGTNSHSGKPTLWFSFDHGPVHYVMYNTEVVCEDPANMAEQYSWMAADLKAASKSGKWIIVMGHRYLHYGYNQGYDNMMLRWGIQCDASGHCPTPLKACTSASGANCKYGLAKLFTTYGVTMVFGGHAHSYIRHYPMHSDGTWEVHDSKRFINTKAPVFIVSGAPGTQHPTYKRDEMLERAEREAQEEQSATEGWPGLPTGSADYTWTYLTVTPTKLTFKQILIKTGKVHDTFTIEKAAKGGPLSHKKYQSRMDPPVFAGVCRQ